MVYILILFCRCFTMLILELWCLRKKKNIYLFPIYKKYRYSYTSPVKWHLTKNCMLNKIAVLNRVL